jgi:hypothetical protein
MLGQVELMTLTVDSMLEHLVTVLQLPSRALSRCRGNRKRIIREIHKRVASILQNQRIDEFTVSSSSVDTKCRDPDIRRIKRCTALVKSGYLSRAARALSQHELPSVNESVISQLEDLHPRSSGPVPNLPTTSPVIAIESGIVAKLVNRRLKNGSAPGPLVGLVNY